MLGRALFGFHFYSQGKRRGHIELGEIGKGFSDFNYFLGYEQSQNEELLYQHLLASGNDVMWNTEFVQLHEYEKNIVCEVKKADQSVSISAKYLIACDGARSPVRHQLQMKFEGGTYENKFFVADTILKWQLDYDGLVISPGDQNFVGFFPMKGKSNYRVLGTLPDEYFEKDNISFDEIRTVILDTIGLPVTFEKVNWFSIYNLHHRRVDRFDKGLVYLAGDAAHIHSPAGGQGMNTGLQDAYNLAWKMSFVIKGWALPEILKSYNEERLPFAKWLMSFTDRAFNLMTSDHPVLAFLRKNIALHMVGLFLKTKLFRPLAFKTVSQIGYSYRGKNLSGHFSTQKLKFKAGDRLPYLFEEGKSKSHYHLFRAPCLHLLHLNDKPLTDHEIADFNTIFKIPMKVVESRITDEWKELGVRQELFVVVRPDNYILCISDHPDSKTLSRKYNRYFHWHS